MSKCMLHSKAFELDGVPIPEFKMQSGKLIRIYIPNFDVKNHPQGFDLTIELIKHFQNQKNDFPWAKNYRQNSVMEFLNPMTVKKYLIHKMHISPSNAERMAQDIEVSLTDKFEHLGFVQRKALTIQALFEHNNCIMLDYYGVAQDGIEFLEKLVHLEIEKGKTAIAFDRLEFMADNEPYANIEPIIISRFGV